MQLSKLQAYFREYIFDPENSDAEKIKSAITIPPSDTITERLAIYADGYDARLGEVLEKTFSVLKKYSGDEIFETWCSEYIRLYPSQYFSVARLGYQFSIFLKNKNFILESEIASLEWAINTAVDAADAVPTTKQDLEAIPQEKWGDLLFECHPSLQILTFSYNILAVYKNLLENQKPEIKDFSNMCRVWRKQTQIYYISISPTENIFIESIEQKLNFSEICERLAEHMPEDEVVNYAIRQILTWLQDELLTDIRVIS